MVSTSDGFKISEVDLRLRGAGDIMGTKQSGILDLKIADLKQDSKILEYARKIAINLLDDDQNLSKSENKVLKENYDRYARDRKNWNWIS